MDDKTFLYLVEKGVDSARRSLDLKALCVATYDAYYVMDEMEIVRLMRDIERESRANRSEMIESLGCIDSGLL